MWPFGKVKCYGVVWLLVLVLAAFPGVSVAGENAGLSLAAGWFIRLGLALIGATAVVVGVILALEGHAAVERLTPVPAPEGGVSLVRDRSLSYRRIGAGLLTVIVGTVFLVTVIFLMPDKRSGHSGITPVVSRLQVVYGKVRERLSHGRGSPQQGAVAGAPR